MRPPQQGKGSPAMPSHIRPHRGGVGGDASGRARLAMVGRTLGGMAVADRAGDKWQQVATQRAAMRLEGSGARERVVNTFETRVDNVHRPKGPLKYSIKLPPLGGQHKPLWGQNYAYRHHTGAGRGRNISGTEPPGGRQRGLG